MTNIHVVWVPANFTNWELFSSKPFMGDFYTFCFATFNKPFSPALSERWETVNVKNCDKKKCWGTKPLFNILELLLCMKKDKIPLPPRLPESWDSSIQAGKREEKVPMLLLHDNDIPPGHVPPQRLSMSLKGTAGMTPLEGIHIWWRVSGEINGRSK